MRFRRLRSLSCLGVLVLAAGSAQAFTPHASTHDLEFPLEWETVPAVFESQRIETTTFGRSALGTGWVVQTNPRTGFLHMAYGGNVFAANGIAGESEAVGAARDFLLANADLLGVRSGNLELRVAKQARGKWVAHFKQVVNGIPVYRANAFVLMDEAGRVAAFGSDFFPETNDVPARPSINEADAIATAAAALGTTPRADRPATTERFWVPAPQGELMELTLAYRVVFESDEPFGKWESFVDASTGNILARRNLYFPVNVIGTVEGDVQNQPPSYGWCDGSAIEGMANLTVNVSGGNSDVTDASGDFDISHGGTSNVTVTAQLLGPYSNINRFSGLGADASFSGPATPGTPLTITWDGSNSRQDERTTFFQANKVHDQMKVIDPTFTELDYAMPSVIGRTDGFCPGNAWWDSFGMNYCEGNATYGNTGELGNVIYHEFGHGVTQEVYQRNGASEPPGDLHEGNSDVIANYLDRNSIIGIGFFQGNCVSGIRDADNTLQYPDDLTGSGHTDGQIIAGFHWDSWQALLGAKPQAEADSIAYNAWHFARDLGLPTNQPDQVLWNFLVDDDDGILENGTPNREYFCVGALNHGFDCPDAFAVFVDHDRLPHTTDGSAGFNVEADVTVFIGTLDPSSVQLSYRVDGGGFVDVPMISTGGNTFQGSIPAILAGEVEYYLQAKNTDDSTGTSPPGAPGNLHAFDVATVYDDLESGSAGWTVINGATTGNWEVIDPVGTAAQPEDDSTPAPGTMAWITGQCGSGGGTCGNGCTLGCNDVDGGTTTLTSPVYDLTGATAAKVKYDRWYSNDTGAAPGTDTWVVEVSNDAGGSWTNVESTMTSNASWLSREIDIDLLFGTPGQVQVRFLASDLGSGSIVEAGVDEIRILSTMSATDAPQLAGSAPITFDLEQNQPNPFRPETRISYSIPTTSKVDLTVYNVAGQAIRRLASGVKEAGRYDVQWDGRDLGGQRVAAGVYFYRLVAGEQKTTRKMTVLQ